MKIQVLLIVPAINASFNVMLPKETMIKELLLLLIHGVKELSNNSYVSSKEEFLCLDPLKRPLDELRTLSQYGVQNGDHLYLI